MLCLTTSLADRQGLIFHTVHATAHLRLTDTDTDGKTDDSVDILKFDFVLLQITQTCLSIQEEIIMFSDFLSSVKHFL